MKTKLALALAVALVTAGAMAHDEGHGPKVTDAAKHGGVLSPIIDAKESKLGAKAKLVYKAELVRSEEGVVRLYVYDDKMSALGLEGFEETASAVLMARKSKSVRFELKREGSAFVGKAPAPARKPFSIDVTLKENDRGLLAAFDNLD